MQAKDSAAPAAPKPLRFDQAVEQYRADEDGMTIVFDDPYGSCEIDLYGPTSDAARYARHTGAISLTSVATVGEDGAIDMKLVDKYRTVKLIDDAMIEMCARRTRAWRGIVADDAGTPVPCTYENALTLYRADQRYVKRFMEEDRRRNATFRRARGNNGAAGKVVRGNDAAERPKGSGKAVLDASRGARAGARKARKGSARRASRS